MKASFISADGVIPRFSVAGDIYLKIIAEVIFMEKMV